MPFNIDPEQSVSIVAVFLFIDAALIGFPLLSALIGGGGAAPLGLVLLAGLIAAGVGILKGRQWAWYLAVGVVGLKLLFDLAGIVLLALIFDGLAMFLLVQPGLRSRFGVR
ncbi:MAG TPA: hypothetical protein VF995_08285 [Actinomycetota bacterium]